MLWQIPCDGIDGSDGVSRREAMSGCPSVASYVVLTLCRHEAESCRSTLLPLLALLNHVNDVAPD